MPDEIDTLRLQKKIRALTEKIIALPTLPAMFDQLNRLLMNPRTSVKEVAQLISTDPAISSKILKVVNSPFYGFPSRITTVSHAIVILGFTTIKSLILSTSIFDVFKGQKEDEGFDRTEFWRHCIGSGVSAKVIGRLIGYPQPEELFIAGLLHDIGKIAFDYVAHDVFSEIINISRQQDCLFVDAEMQLLGTTHADIGGWVFTRWNLSRGLIDCTTYHHNPAMSKEHTKIASLVHLSDIITRALQFGKAGDDKIPQLSEVALKSLGFDESIFPKLLYETDQEIQKALVFLEFLG